MGDEDVAGVVLLLDALEHVHDVGLGQHVQRGGGLVQEDQGRVGDHGHGDGHPLAHPAAQLEGVALQEVHRHPHVAEGRRGLLQGLGFAHAHVLHEGLRHLISHPQHRIQGVHGGLGHEGDAQPADVLAELLLAHPNQLLAIQEHAAAEVFHVPGQQAQQGPGQGGLATARLPQDDHGLVAGQLEADPVHGLDHAPSGAEVQFQVLHLEECVALGPVGAQLSDTKLVGHERVSNLCSKKPKKSVHGRRGKLGDGSWGCGFALAGLEPPIAQSPPFRFSIPKSCFYSPRNRGLKTRSRANPTMAKPRPVNMSRPAGSNTQ